MVSPEYLLLSLNCNDKTCKCSHPKMIRDHLHSHNILCKNKQGSRIFRIISFILKVKAQSDVQVYSCYYTKKKTKRDYGQNSYKEALGMISTTTKT